MQVKLDQPLDFIRKKDLIEFVIVHRNGANLIVAGDYSQNVKKSEIDQIMAHNILKVQVAEAAVKKTSKQLMAEAKELKLKEDADAKLSENEPEKPEEKL